MRVEGRTRLPLSVTPYFLINLSVGLTQGLTMVQVAPLLAGEDVVVVEEETISWLVSLGFISAVVGHLAGGATADILGRRRGAQVQQKSSKFPNYPQLHFEVRTFFPKFLGKCLKFAALLSSLHHRIPPVRPGQAPVPSPAR